MKLSLPLGLRDLERDYFRNIMQIMEHLRGAFARKMPKLIRIGNIHVAPKQRTDDWTDEIDEIFSSLRGATDRALEVAPDLIKATRDGVNTRNRKNFLKQMHEALGVNVFENAPQVAATAALFTQTNVSLIKSIPERYLNEVEGIVLGNFQRGRRAEDFQDELEERFGVSESRAALIARDQISKLNGALTQNRQESIGIEYYFWRTSQDERVRDSHAEKEGQRFAWNDPPADTGHPGEDINCRCHADPDVEDLLTSMDEGDEA